MDTYVYRDRKMMKWLPFGALTEQGDYLQALFEKRNQQPKPTLLDDAITEMNYLLEEAVAMHIPITITYFQHHRYHTITGIVEVVDFLSKTITVDNTLITASTITHIEVI